MRGSILLGLVILGTPEISAAASWVPRGPAGAAIGRVTVAPSASDVVYAVSGSARQVFRSADGGATWRLASGGLPDASLGQLAVDAVSPDTAYLKVDRGVFTTTDGGTSWRPCAPFPGFASQAVAAHPAVPGVVFVSGIYDLWRSDDGCATWTPLAPGTAPQWVAGFKFDPFSPASMVTEGIGFFRSDDGGNTWRRIPGVDGRIALSPSHQGVLYLAGRDVYVWGVPPALYKSFDGGDHWTPIGSFPPQYFQEISGFAVVPGAPETLLLSWGPQRLRSIDEGATWQVIDDEVGGWTVSGAGVVYAAASCDDGVARSEDAGVTWTTSSDGLTAPAVSVVAFGRQQKPVLYAGTRCRGLLMTDDRGATWSPTTCPIRSVESLTICGAGPGAIYAAGDWRTIYRSFDGGTTWDSNATPEADFLDAVTCDPKSPETVYLSSSYVGETMEGLVATLWRSTDGGASWSPQWAMDSYDVRASVGGPVFSRQDPRRLYAATGMGVIRSLDDGTSFQLLPGLPGPIREVEVEASTPERIWAVTPSGASVSSDGGETWQATAPAPCSEGFRSVLTMPLPGRAVAAGCNTVLGTSWGSSWSELAPGLPNRQVLSQAADPLNPALLFVATTAGVYSLSLDSVAPMPRRVLRRK